MGFEPMRIATRELESRTLTNSVIFALFVLFVKWSCLEYGGWTVERQSPPKVQDKGFEPLSIAARRPQRRPLTTWVILLDPTNVELNWSYRESNAGSRSQNPVS